MDIRVIKSKKAIKSALKKLMVEKGIDQITICQIAQDAQINRKTFYNCYRDINEVLEEIEDETIKRFTDTILSIELKRGIFDPYLFYEKLSLILNEDLDFFEILFTEKNLGFSEKIVNSVIEKAKQEIKKQSNSNDPKLDFTATFLISGMFSIFYKWVSNGRTESIDEISKTVGKLMIGALREII